MRKINRKIFILGILIVCMLMTTACGSNDSKKEITGSEDNSKENTDMKDTNDSDAPKDTERIDNSDDTESSNDGKTADLETIDEAVLFEEDGVRVTAKEIVDDPIWGKGIVVLIENDTEQNIGVQCNTIVVNNYMISDLFSSTVAAGKKDNETITLLSSSLEEAGIDTISEINISFKVFDADSYDTLFNTDEISIKTSAYGTVEQPAMDSGKELLNKDGIRIVGKYVTEDSIWGAGVLLYIENTSDADVLIQCDNMSVNGYMVTPYFSSQVNKGRMALSPITILSSELEENGIDKVTDFELIFNIINPENYDTIFESDPIPFSVAE
ncbi:hypothetical protein H0486_10140 [Lachnospiraceae bacterium MD1]|uniref:Uncharacterized protein n=1 Tax=Variimorphobacter saccharofermentans TaxID=2755051 RepID=A0A839K1D9_9FIRM|nr:hypothetical protein [Variimorphobacter saccharofermentans]MBB2183238.1 hypothetical protein [Variimorphobacter saccharofermentans]